MIEQKHSCIKVGFRQLTNNSQ